MVVTPLAWSARGGVSQATSSRLASNIFCGAQFDRTAAEEHVSSHGVIAGVPFAAGPFVPKRKAWMALLFALVSCDLQLSRTVPAAPSPNEKASAVSPPAVVVEITGLRDPESVLHDPEQDVYFISNINGGLLDVDGNGFISRVDAATMAVDLRWIESGVDGARLDAPKGMAILGDSLYVADVTAVRRFDRRTGKPRPEIPIDGATLINDLTTDGRSIYVSDTGVRPGPGITFVSTGTDAIWKITGDRAEKIASGPGLDHPNGVEFSNGRLWVASFRGTGVYRLEGDRKSEVVRFPRGQLDGLVTLPGGGRLVSSWLGTAIYRDTDGAIEPVLTGIATPADIGYDVRRGRLLVPRTASNLVTVHGLTASSPP
jgi:hypothetical protein